MTKTKEDYLQVKNIGTTNGSITLKLSSATVTPVHMYYTKTKPTKPLTEWTLCFGGGTYNIPVYPGEIVYFCSELTTTCYDPQPMFTSNIILNEGAEFELSGSLLSLMDLQGTKTDLLAADYTFYELFKDSKGLVSVNSDIFLHINSLGFNAYDGIFKGCTNLKHIRLSCFNDDILGVSTLNNMFLGCSSLNFLSVSFTKWELFEDIVATNNWLAGVSATGDFYCDAELPIIRDNSHIPEGWTVHVRRKRGTMSVNKDTVLGLH